MANDKTRYTEVYSGFKGVDYYHSTANVSKSRGVKGLNIVRGELGTISKRTGYGIDENLWEDKINGIHFLRRDEGDICLIHRGVNFYTDDGIIFSRAADNRSRSLQFGDSLYILDGNNYLRFDGVTVTKVADEPYVPLVYTNRTPEGGGRKKEPANILTTRKTDGFIADGASTVYKLSHTGLKSDDVTAVIYNDDGTFYTVTTGSRMAVNTETGTVVFDRVPPKTRNGDEDNVFITYDSGEVTGGVLEKCTVMGMFGRGGRPDTLFLSGNPDYPGREWYSYRGKPDFFGENNTDVALDSGCKVMGYSHKGDKLFVHRRSGGSNLNVLVRKSAGTNRDNYTYPVVNALDGPGAVSSDSFVNMVKDSLFLTENGIYAVTEADRDENHFAQNRSIYINPVLLKCENLQKAVATVYEDFYVLAVGGDIFLLDTAQKSYEEEKGTSRYRYECYHWQIEEDIRLLFVQDGRLCFATEDGRIGRFYKDVTAPDSYNDNGRPINALWQTGRFTAGESRRMKSIHRLWLVCRATNAAGSAVYSVIKGGRHKLFTIGGSAGCFIWSKLNWAAFTWSADRSSKLISKNVKIKNFDKTSIILENKELNRPFTIYEFGVEYTKGDY